ncbi:nicotinamide/nicotinic acid mononucleotide adenylyltransferase isoform X2 [Aristolochia californica]|uniref:nicotinamide/nicotinic acid mononucleotide adenylyltransferase isoform X2 n=1 Tax=Aristolochia californica TaxID=171875 RepID=UPI0035DE1D2F
MEIPLPLDKLSFGGKDDVSSSDSLNKSDGQIFVVLVSAGSFNPPTYMHLRMFDHRIRMSELACQSSPFIMVDSWEAKQSSFQRTVKVLNRIRSFLTENGVFSQESLKVMLLCGSDLLESFATPGVWIPEQVRSICRDYGVVCICREGKNMEKIISVDEILSEYKTNILVVDEQVPNQISSTRLRDCLMRGRSIKYLTADEVIEYIQQHRLYVQ